MQDDKINNDDIDDLDFDDIDDLDDGLDSEQEDDVSLDDDMITDDLGEEFPEDEDFSDEDWGDEDNETDAKGQSSHTNTRSKRSSKIVLPLAAFVVIAGAGGFYVMNTISGPSTSSQQMLADDNTAVPSDVGLDITEETLPMPSPMASPVEQEEEQMLDYAENTKSEDTTPDTSAPDEALAGGGRMGSLAGNEVLTPMPGLQKTEQDTTAPLGSLGLDEAPELNANDSNNLNTEENVVANITSTPDAVDTVKNNEDSSLATPPEIIFKPAPPPMNSEAEMAPPAEQTGNEMPDDAPTADINVTKYKERIDTLENNLSNKDEAISNLTAEINILQKKLSNKEAALEEARLQLKAQPEPKQKSSQETNSVAKENTAANTAKPSPKPRAEAEAKINPKWELRAAQPGRAYIGIIGSNDTQIVEVGDTIQGVGQIKSIGLENAIWVVQGTNGAIKQ